jgi:hypothetical protein
LLGKVKLVRFVSLLGPSAPCPFTGREVRAGVSRQSVASRHGRDGSELGRPITRLACGPRSSPPRVQIPRTNTERGLWFSSAFSIDVWACSLFSIFKLFFLRPSRECSFAVPPPLLPPWLPFWPFFSASTPRSLNGSPSRRTQVEWFLTSPSAAKLLPLLDHGHGTALDALLAAETAQQARGQRMPNYRKTHTTLARILSLVLSPSSLSLSLSLLQEAQSLHVGALSA